MPGPSSEQTSGMYSARMGGVDVNIVGPADAVVKLVAIMVGVSTSIVTRSRMLLGSVSACSTVYFGGGGVLEGGCYLSAVLGFE